MEVRRHRKSVNKQTKEPIQGEKRRINTMILWIANAVQNKSDAFV